MAAPGVAIGVGIESVIVAATTAIGWCLMFGLLYVWNGTFHRIIEATASRIEGIGIRGRFRPDIGLSPVANAIRNADNAVIVAMETWIRGAEILLAAFWEAVADVFDWVGNEIAAVSETASNAMARIVRHSIPSAENRAVARANRHVAPIARDTAWVTDVALPRARARDETLADRVGHVADRIGHVGQRVRANEKKLAAGAFAAAVMTALRSMGLRQIRCPNVRRNLKRFCGMNPALLDMFLLGGLSIAGALSLERMTRELLGQMDTFEAALRRGYKEI